MKTPIGILTTEIRKLNIELRIWKGEENRATRQEVENEIRQCKIALNILKFINFFTK